MDNPDTDNIYHKEQNKTQKKKNNQNTQKT